MIPCKRHGPDDICALCENDAKAAAVAQEMKARKGEKAPVAVPTPAPPGFGPKALDGMGRLVSQGVPIGKDLALQMIAALRALQAPARPDPSPEVSRLLTLVIEAARQVQLYSDSHSHRLQREMDERLETFKAALLAEFSYLQALSAPSSPAPDAFLEGATVIWTGQGGPVQQIAVSVDKIYGRWDSGMPWTHLAYLSRPNLPTSMPKDTPAQARPAADPADIAMMDALVSVMVGKARFMTLAKKWNASWNRLKASLEAPQAPAPEAREGA